MEPQSNDVKEIDYKNYKEVEKRELCPTKEVDPTHFIEPDLAWFLHIFQNLFLPSAKTFHEVFNCVHCNACETSNARYYLKRKLHNADLKSQYTGIMIESFEKFDTPFNQSNYRLKIPEEVPKDSDTLLFMGCLSSMKVPEFTSNAIKYMLSKGHNFTILDREICCGIPLIDSGESEILKELVKKNTELFNSRKFKKIICVCPACYDIFNSYKPYKGIKAEVVFVSDYLEPLKNKRSETMSIQHLCQLEYRGRKDVRQSVEKILKESGFKMMDEKHWCCGLGMGMMHVVGNIERIARIRVNDFHGELLTTYCPSCYHGLKLFSKREKIKSKLVDIFKLLTE